MYCIGQVQKECVPSGLWYFLVSMQLVMTHSLLLNSACSDGDRSCLAGMFHHSWRQWQEAQAGLLSLNCFCCVCPVTDCVWASRLLSGTLSVLSCAVAVANRLDAANVSSGFTYNSQLTPVIAEVSPRRGGTAGGTRLTIAGSGFRCGGGSCSPRCTYDDTIETRTHAHTQIMVRELTSQFTQSRNSSCFTWVSSFHWD